MKNVEMARMRLARGLDHSLKQFLTWLSCTEGNLEETDQLRIALDRSDLKPEPELIAKLTETVLEHLGHKTRVNGIGNGYEAMSKARRVAAKL
jgi:hypothetical protein